MVKLGFTSQELLNAHWPAALRKIEQGFPCQAALDARQAARHGLDILGTRERPPADMTVCRYAAMRELALAFYARGRDQKRRKA